MNQDLKIWKISLFLLLGLFVFVYIVSSTVADVYFLINDPVAGFMFEFDKERSQAVVQHVVPRGPADMAGLKEGDIVLSINARALRTAEDAEKEPYPNIRPGEPVKFKILRDNQEIDFTVESDSHIRVYTRSFFQGLLPGVAFSYSLCLIGLFVLLKKIDDRVGHIFFLMVMFWALAMWGVFSPGTPALYKVLPGWFTWILQLFWPLAVGLLLHFTLIFPVEKQSFARHKPWFFLLMYGNVLLIGLQVVGSHYGWNWSAEWLPAIWSGWFSVNFAVAMSMLGHTRGTVSESHVAKQANIILAGTAWTLVLPTGLYFLPQAFFNYKLPFAEFILLVVVLWPSTLAYAIVRHRFMNIDVIVKRGVAYAVMSGFVVAAYLVFVVGAGRLVLFLTGSESQLITIIATLAIAALFSPIKERVQSFVDRRFFPTRFTYREAVRGFIHRLVNVVDLATLQEMLLSFLSTTMKIRPVMFFWRDEQAQEFVQKEVKGGDSSPAIAFGETDRVVQRLAKTQKLVDFSLLKETPDLVPVEELQPWQSVETEIALPLLSKGELVGFITLGSKTDNEAYYNEDIELLETLGDQLNISLANALLTEELREQERLKKELEVARRIQLSTLPQSDPDVPGLDISGISIPAYEVGGDYYDYLLLSDGRFGVVVGDVSGKGTSAALYMSQLKGILQTAAKFCKSLKDLMVEVNAVAFCNIEEQSFITLTCGAFDVKKHKFNLVRAGHLPLIYYSKDANCCTELVPGGIGVGLEYGKVFRQELEEEEVGFAPGDVFLFYSDGIVEARNSRGEEFESQPLFDILLSNGYANANELRETILARVREFTNGSAQQDDMTLVVVKIK